MLLEHVDLFLQISTHKKHNFPMKIPGSQNLGSRLIYVILLPKFVDLRNSQKLVNLGRFVTQGAAVALVFLRFLPPPSESSTALAALSAVL